MQICKSNIKRNQRFLDDLKNFSFLNYIQEIISDILLEVKTQPLPFPDTSKPEIRRELFHKNNKNKNLNYNEVVYEQFEDLRQKLCDEAGQNKQQYWNMDIKQIFDMIQEIEDIKKREKYYLQFLRIKNLSLSSHKSNHYIQQEIKNKLENILDGIPNIVQQQKEASEIPESFIVNEKLIDQQLLQSQAGGGEIKSLKKFKTEEEKRQFLQEFCNSVCAVITQNFTDILCESKEQKFEKKILYNYDELREKYYTDHIDQISRKFKIEPQMLENKRALVTFTFETTQQNIENQQQELTIDNLQKEQLEKFVGILYYLESQQLKFTQIYIQLKNNKKQYVKNSIQFLFEYLKNETELNIQWEPHVVIQDFKEKLQNDHFEDGCIVICENALQNAQLVEKYMDEYNIQRSTNFLDNYHEMRKLLSQTDILIDCNINEIFESCRLSQVYEKNIRLFGPDIQKCIEFVRKYNQQIILLEENHHKKQRQMNLLIIGGDIQVRKIQLMLFSQNYYTKIMLSGIIGLKFFMYNRYIQSLENQKKENEQKSTKNDSNEQIDDENINHDEPNEQDQNQLHNDFTLNANFQNLLSKKDIQCIEIFYENFEDKSKLIFPDSFQYVEIDQNLQKTQEEDNNQKVLNVQNYQKEVQQSENLKIFDQDTNFEGEIILADNKNILQFNVLKKLKQQVNEAEDETKANKSNQIDQIDIQDIESQTLLQQFQIMNLGNKFQQLFIDYIEQAQNVLIIDEFWLQAETDKKNLINSFLEHFMTYLNQNYQIFEDTQQENIEIREKFNMCGSHLVQEINFTQFQKILKIRQILLKKEKEKKKLEQKKKEQEDKDIESEEMQDQTEESQIRSDEEEEEIESEESEENSDDENEELSQNINKISNNVFKNSNLLLNMLCGKYSEKIDVYDEYEKVIADPDDKDFSFLQELEQIKQ